MEEWKEHITFVEETTKKIMVQKPLVTYSILSYMWDKEQNFLDTYVPLVYECINSRATSSKSTISHNDVQKWLNEVYGISNISKGACESIMKRMQRQNLLSREKGKYVINDSEFIKFSQSKSSFNEVDKDFSDLISGIIQYAEERYKKNLSSEDVEKGLSDFLRTHDGDLLFENEKLFESLGRQREGKTNLTKYIISRYLLYCRESKKEKEKQSLGKMINLAKGHALSSLVSMDDLTPYVGKLDDVQIALDTPIVYTIMGLSDSTNLELIKELLNRLKELGAHFVLFDNNYNEVTNTISNTIDLLRTKNYDLKRSSRLLRYAVRNNISADKLHLHLQQLDDVLKKWEILRIDAPDYEKGYEEINTQKLTDIISNIYTEKSGEELQEYLKNMIEIDVDTISYIYRMRGNSNAKNLKSSKAIMLTTNTAIAFASKNEGLSRTNHIIPPCMTDVFLSTILWTNYPTKNDKLNEKLLINDCLRNIALDEAILRRLYNDIKVLSDENRITEEQVLLTNTSKLVYELLEEKTFNDISLYTDKTTEEILQEIDLGKDIKINEKQTSLNTHYKNLHKTAHCCAGCAFWVIWIILFTIFLFAYFLKHKCFSNTLNIILFMIFMVPALWGIFTYGGLIPSKVNIIEHLEKCIYKKLCNILDNKDK